MERSLTPLSVRSAQTFGPYCCFTGRVVRPWHLRVLRGLYHLVTLLAVAAITLRLVGTDISPGSALTAAVAAAGLYLASAFAPRFHAPVLVAVLLLGLEASIHTWGDERPLLLTTLSGWGESADAWLAKSDAFLAQAARTSTFSLSLALHALATAGLLVGLLISVVRAWGLPRRLWFARHHPVWRRPYALGDSPHPLLGVLAVHRDPLLSQKLVWLEFAPGSDALRIGARGQEERADAPRVPLAEQLGDVVLLRDGDGWHVSGTLPMGDHAELRSVLIPLHPAGRKALGERRYTEVDSLPVRDLFADDNALFGKHVPEAQRAHLFGLLLDSRPAPAEGAPAVPRFCVLVERGGQLEVEYTHPDLVRHVPLELSGDSARLPWRGAGEGRASDDDGSLELTRGVDSIHRVRTEDEDYHLLFLAFGARA